MRVRLARLGQMFKTLMRDHHLLAAERQAIDELARQLRLEREKVEIP